MPESPKGDCPRMLGSGSMAGEVSTFDVYMRFDALTKAQLKFKF